MLLVVPSDKTQFDATAAVSSLGYVVNNYMTFDL